MLASILARTIKWKTISCTPLMKIITQT